MRALYVEQDFDDRMGYMLVENKNVIEIVNQIENYGILTQYQRHWEIVDAVSEAVDADLILLTEAKALAFLAEFKAAGGKYVEAGVALMNHASPPEASTSDFAAIKEKIAEYVAESDDEDDED
jgi:hypothetical protein